MTRRFIIFGRVQGVAFRYFIQGNADRLGLLGWVRNRRDGTVEALAQGDELQITEFRRILNQGPPISRVDGVEEFEAEPIESKHFTITR